MDNPFITATIFIVGMVAAIVAVWFITTTILYVSLFRENPRVRAEDIILGSPREISNIIKYRGQL